MAYNASGDAGTYDHRIHDTPSSSVGTPLHPRRYMLISPRSNITYRPVMSMDRKMKRRVLFSGTSTKALSVVHLTKPIRVRQRLQFGPCRITA